MKSVVLFLGLLLFPVAASADVITLSGTGTTSGNLLSASATFDITGDILTITLSNTAAYNYAADGQLTPAELLSGVFWTWSTGGATLTPLSATVAAGSIVQGSTCSTALCTSSTTNVGGEFRYDSGSWAFAPGTTNGVAGSGYIGGAANLNGPDLDFPTAVSGMNFGIAPSGFVAGNGNGGVDNEPLIVGPVTFRFSGATGLLASNINNVVFTYGTSPDATIQVPEPATLSFLGLGLLGAASLFRKKAKTNLT